MSVAGMIVRLDEGDADVDNGVDRLERQFGYEVITESYLNGHTAEQKLANIRSGGTLIVHGHGDTTELGNRSPTQLAKLLADGGLRGPVVISLYACNGGTGGAPYALELKVALVQGHKVMCSVDGRKGFLGLFPGGQWVVKTQPDENAADVAKPMYATTQPF